MKENTSKAVNKQQLSTTTTVTPKAMHSKYIIFGAKKSSTITGSQKKCETEPAAKAIKEKNGSNQVRVNAMTES